MHMGKLHMSLRNIHTTKNHLLCPLYNVLPAAIIFPVIYTVFCKQPSFNFVGKLFQFAEVTHNRNALVSGIDVPMLHPQGSV